MICKLQCNKFLIQFYFNIFINYMEEGDNHPLIKFSDVAKLGGVANPAESQNATWTNLEKLRGSAGRGSEWG